MTDVREKLVELLQHDNCPLFMVFGDKVDVLADYLIAHGVTVQEWIPVEDRLPEPFTSVLAYVPSESPLPLVHESYLVDETLWVCILERRLWKDGAVTHWMPMPEPPKGE